ncbi:MAG: CPBP family intramembrane metalloprotease [bacterium]|nr:CPBP family intramembrane metalloprotease [bacterium]
MQMKWDSRTQRVAGWAFLLGISVFYAVLNLGGTGFLLAPLALLFDRGAMADGSEPALWQLALAWFTICLIYVPAYWVLAFSTKRLGWSLREWGFGFSGRSWLAIGPSILLVVLAWFPATSAPSTGKISTDIFELREAFSEVGVPMLLFLGYARIAEELIYRGFALVFLRRFLPPARYRAAIAVVISSALFCLVHAHFSPGAILALFVGGAVPLAVVTVWSRSLSLALVMHGAVGGGPVGALLALLFFFVLALAGRPVRRNAES